MVEARVGSMELKDWGFDGKWYISGAPYNVERLRMVTNSILLPSLWPYIHFRIMGPISTCGPLLPFTAKLLERIVGNRFLYSPLHWPIITNASYREIRFLVFLTALSSGKDDHCTPYYWTAGKFLTFTVGNIDRLNPCSFSNTCFPFAPDVFLLQYFPSKVVPSSILLCFPSYSSLVSLAYLSLMFKNVSLLCYFIDSSASQFTLLNLTSIHTLGDLTYSFWPKYQLERNGSQDLLSRLLFTELWQTHLVQKVFTDGGPWLNILLFFACNPTTS